MSNESATGEGVDTEVPDAVKEWLSSVAAERGLSEIELLRAMLTGGEPGPAGGRVDSHELDQFEREFRSLIEDVRERVIQVKREADRKAPADHDHHDLVASIDQLGEELQGLQTDVEALDERLVGGFDNYEDILTYLTETTDELHRRLEQLASAVIDLRERVGDATRDEVRRTALAHLTQTANRHGVERARCASCEETIDVSLLVEPRCPHCDSAFTSLEPKRGFFRKAVLHTGTMPALESAPAIEDSAAGDLEHFVDQAVEEVGDAPTVEPAPEPTVAEPRGTPTTPDDEQSAGDPAVRRAKVEDGDRDLQTIDGIGPAYADRLQEAGVDGVLALAVADPEELGEAIDVPPATVADWIEQADAMAGTS